MKLLVTGFDPFGGEKINPAIESVKLLADEISGAEIIKLEIPTVFNKSLAVIGTVDWSGWRPQCNQRGICRY